MRLFLLFYLISVSVFSQQEKQTVFIQADYGFTSYSNPSVKTNGLCPTAEILFLSTNSKRDSSKFSGCFMAALALFEPHKPLTY